METTFVVLKNQYKDSIELLRLSAEVEKLETIDKAAVMMGTPSNLKLMQEAGYFKEGETGATPNDIVVGLVIPKGTKDAAMKEVTKILTTEAKSKSRSEGKVAPRTIADAVRQLAETSDNKPNIAIISVPGPYASAETLKALKRGMHVFLFSDNVPIEDEIELKKYASSKNLLLMGPDCGTSVLDGVPFGFANKIRRGKIGLVGAAGTGLQQVSCLIDQFGEGVSQMIGVGGHDLGEQVGGLMMLQGIDRLSKDPNTEVITLVSKAPSPSVTAKIFDKIKTVSKPVVVCFLGELGKVDTKAYITTSLADAALCSTQLAQGKKPTETFLEKNWDKKEWKIPKSGHIEGLFSGGTFCKETSLLLSYLKKNGAEGLSYAATDLGDSQYTVGKPHPMIDPSTRKQFIVKAAKDPKVTVILLDVVLGYGSNEDPAGALVPAIKEAFRIANSEKRELKIVAQVCGTADDPQGLHEQEEKLKQAGVLLAYNNAEAAITAAKLIGNCLKENPKEPKRVSPTVAKEQPLMFGGFSGVSLGLKGFLAPLLEHGAKIVHLEWKPPAEGDREAGWIMAKLASSEEGYGKLIDEANAKGLERLLEAQPLLVDFSTAKDALPNFGNEKKILHAGAPLKWNQMCGPMQGAIAGAILYEGWAKNDKEAFQLASSGEVQFDSCHHYSAVGPMAGIISPTMPVLVVQNAKGPKNFAFSNLNEGLGKALRFGAYEDSVLTRLKWMRDSLGPSLSKALKQTGPIDLRALTAQAITMGDEVHNRNVAATCLFARVLAPYVPKDVLEFFQKNDHFFLNFSMACSKAILDTAHNIENSTIVTAMARNGVEFAIRMSGTGGEWFRQPAPVIEGLYFPGYSVKDANPDLGDSAITETCGIGGFAMAASPAIVKFVGGSASDSFSYTEEMYTICLAKNPLYSIPSMDFRGTPLGIDARKVIDQNTRPVVNTGIASKLPGVGQIGAGITRGPTACFSSALHSLYNKMSQKRTYSTKSNNLSKSALKFGKKLSKFFR